MQITSGVLIVIICAWDGRLFYDENHKLGEAWITTVM
jgi:hypothetical protein